MAKRILHIIFKVLKYLVISLGIISLVMIVLSFTDQPYMAYYRLGAYKAHITTKPDYIVVMGAGGMPGPEGLMRCHYAAKAALKYPEAKLIIALPTGDVKLTNSDAWDMYEEIHRWGVEENRVIFETKGTNTYTQARNIYQLLQDTSGADLLIVSSPEHMYRCIRTFEKCGFQHVAGLPAFEASFDENLLLTKKERERRFREIDRSVSLRYNMWTYLKYEISVIRESLAIAWYEIRGYI